MNPRHKMLAVVLFLAASVIAGTGCGASQKSSAEDAIAAASAQSHVKTPELDGEALDVCDKLKSKGIAASIENAQNGFILRVASTDEDVVGNLQNKAKDRVVQRQDLEEAFAEVKTSKHDESDALYVRFEHEDESVLKEIQDILQAGIDKRKMAKGRVHLELEDGHLDMNLPTGAMARIKASKGADETVEKWTDRKPTTFELKNTEDGIELNIQADEQERLEELKSNIDAQLKDCESDAP